MNQAAHKELSKREWTGARPYVGTNGTMFAVEEATPSQFSGPKAKVTRLEPTETGSVAEEHFRAPSPAPAEVMLFPRDLGGRAMREPSPGMAEALLFPRDLGSRPVLAANPVHLVVELERRNSVRCILAAANAARSVSRDMEIAVGGDPVVSAMNVLARAFNSYRDCSAKTIHELKKDTNTREEAARREVQAQTFYAYFNTSGSHYNGTISDGTVAPAFNVREEYQEMHDWLYEDLSDDPESDDEAAQHY